MLFSADFRFSLDVWVKYDWPQQHFSIQFRYVECYHCIVCCSTEVWMWMTHFSSLPQITSVCNFFTYIRYILQGLVKQQDGKLITYNDISYIIINLIDLDGSKLHISIQARCMDL